MLTKTVEIDWLILVAPAANVKQDLNYPSIKHILCMQQLCCVNQSLAVSLPAYGKFRTQGLLIFRS